MQPDDCPPDPSACQKNEDDQTQFDSLRVSQAQCRSNDRLELAFSGGRDNLTIPELGHNRLHPGVDDHLRGDEQRERYQQADLNLQVVEERDLDSTEALPVQQSQHQQRRPRQQSNDEDPPPDTVQWRLHEAHAEKKLIKGSAGNEGEFLGLA